MNTQTYTYKHLKADVGFKLVKPLKTHSNFKHKMKTFYKVKDQDFNGTRENIVSLNSINEIKELQKTKQNRQLTVSDRFKCDPRG